MRVFLRQNSHMTPHTFACPRCAAPINIDTNSAALAVKCAHCGISAPVPAAFRPTSKLSDDVMSEVNTLLRDKRAIDAIKLVRARTGLGLKEAKDFVEALESGDIDQLNTLWSAHGQEPQVATVVVTGRRQNVARGGGCGVTAMILVMIAIPLTFAAVMSGAVNSALTALQPAATRIANDLGVDVPLPKPRPPAYSPSGDSQILFTEAEPSPLLLSVGTKIENGRGTRALALEDPKIGSTRWTAAGDDILEARIDAQGIIVAAKRRLRMIDPASGETRWEALLSDELAPSCVACLVLTEKRVFALSADDELQAFDRADGRKLNAIAVPRAHNRLHVLADGVVVVHRASTDKNQSVVATVYAGGESETKQIQLSCDEAPSDSGADIPVIVDAQQRALFVWLSHRTTCIARFDLSSGARTWMSQVDVTATPNFYRASALISDGGVLYGLSDQAILRLRSDGGAALTPIAFDPEYSPMRVFGQRNGALIASVQRLRGTPRTELWAIDVETGARLWALPLDDGSPMDNDRFFGLINKDDSRYGWAAQLTPEGVRLLRVKAGGGFKISLETLNTRSGVSSGEMSQEFASKTILLKPALLAWRADSIWLYSGGEHIGLDAVTLKVLYQTP